MELRSRDPPRFASESESSVAIDASDSAQSEVSGQDSALIFKANHRPSLLIDHHMGLRPEAILEFGHEVFGLRGVFDVSAKQDDAPRSDRLEVVPLLGDDGGAFDSDPKPITC